MLFVCSRVHSRALACSRVLAVTPEEPKRGSVGQVLFIASLQRQRYIPGLPGRARVGSAMATGEDECDLLKLSHDEVSIVTHELCDPLRPLLAVHLSSTAKGLWEPMQEQLAELRQRHAEAEACAASLGFESRAALVRQLRRALSDMASGGGFGEL